MSYLLHHFTESSQFSGIARVLLACLRKVCIGAVLVGAAVPARQNPWLAETTHGAVPTTGDESGYPHAEAGTSTSIYHGGLPHVMRR